MIHADVLTGARLGHHSEAQVSAFFGELISDVVPVDVSVVGQAADFRARLESLQMPHALILATAEVDPDVDLVISGALPGWLGWSAIVLGAASYTPAGFFAFRLGLVWVLVASILLTIRARTG